jgi:hypothetical protein
MAGDVILNDATVTFQNGAITINHSVPPEVMDRLGQILTAVQRSESEAEEMNAEMQAAMDRLSADVQQTRDGEAAAVKLIEGIAQQLRDAAGDPAAVNALADSLEKGAADLGASVVANTPADTSGGSTGGSTGGTDTGGSTPT